MAMAEATTRAAGYQPPRLSRERYQSLATNLWSERATFDSHWREIADYIEPRRTRFFAGDRNRGDRRNQKIIDSSATMALRTLRSGMHAGLTSPARPWMKLSTPDLSLARFPPVRAWLHDMTDLMLTIFGMTNLYNMLPVVYGDIGAFGTAAMSVQSDSRDLFRCYTFPVGSYALGLDERQRVSTFVRQYQLTVRQIVAEFGGEDGQPVTRGQMIQWKNISKGVKRMWESGRYEAPVDLTWIVLPNADKDEQRYGAKHMPFRSCHFEKSASEDKVLRESGYKTFPVLAPRWDITGEDSYGVNSPGMVALGDVKQLQEMQRRKGTMLQKAIDPSLVGPQSLMNTTVSLLPGGFTPEDVRDGMKGLRPIHDVRLEGYGHLVQDVGEVRYRIQRAFYEDLFLMLAQSDDRLGAERPTATEVRERHEEKMLALGPVLERTNDELLDPLIDRVFQMMLDSDLVPTPPQELENMELRVEYISIMAQAQKLVGVTSVDRYMQTAIGLAEVFPESRYKTNVSEALDHYGQMLGVPPKIVRETEEADAMAAQANQAQAEAVNAQTAKDSALAMKSASETSLEGDSALSRMVRTAGGQV